MDTLTVFVDVTENDSVNVIDARDSDRSVVMDSDCVASALTAPRRVGVPNVRVAEI